MRGGCEGGEEGVGGNALKKGLRMSLRNGLSRDVKTALREGGGADGGGGGGPGGWGGGGRGGGGAAGGGAVGGARGRGAGGRGWDGGKAG